MTDARLKELRELKNITHAFARDFTHELRECLGEIDRLRAQREKFRAALDEIASWKEGAAVSGTFDEPNSAELARKALGLSDDKVED